VYFAPPLKGFLWELGTGVAGTQKQVGMTAAGQRRYLRPDE